MSATWYTSARFRTLALWSIGLFVVGFGIDSVFIRDNDFLWHYDLGQAFLKANDETLQAGGMWYPLGRRMMNAALVAVPYRLARALVYVLSLVLFAIAIRQWQRMADASERRGPATCFAAAALSLVFLMPHLSRDLQECGLQLILLAILTAAGYALWSGQSIRAGFWLALGITYKTTPLLFLPLLVWKRQWRAAAATVVFVIAMNLLPALYLGWDLTVRAHGESWAYFQKSAHIENIAENGIEEPNPRNQALMSLFARFLQSYPPDHSLVIDHPAFLQFGDLDHATARTAAKMGLLLLGGYVAWRLWGRWTAYPRDLPAQWAAVCVFAALLSPICWRQHLVLVWPALFLLVHTVLGSASRWKWALLGGTIVLLWAPQNEIIGSVWTSVLMAYKLDTLIFLIWALALLHRPPAAAGESAALAPTVTPSPAVSQAQAA
jgi:hypothetical protein